MLKLYYVVCNGNASPSLEVSLQWPQVRGAMCAALQ